MNNYHKILLYNVYLSRFTTKMPKFGGGHQFVSYNNFIQNSLFQNTGLLMAII